ncbi:Protein MMS22-like [Oopsacas minuta]|uniref:Protein MMS22-like n=1 Tax=Oopsacas minuta TaxID=111878 RepID=A0AAV7K292_9METZ|nr:Protein MMS22-like [Oopsacas minuta]
MISQKWYSNGLELNEDDERSYTREEFSLFSFDYSNSFIPYSAEFYKDTVNLFSIIFLSFSDFVTNHKAMFNLFKQHLMLSEESALTHVSVPNLSHLQHCHVFLHFLVYSLASASPREWNKCDLQLFGDTVSSQLETVCLLVIQLSEANRSSNMMIPSPHAPQEVHPYTQLLIDIKTHLLLSHHYITRLVPEYKSHTFEFIKYIWTDLLEQSLVIFSTHSDLLRLNFSPFNCYSHIEIWCLSAQLSDILTADGQVSGFWNLFIPTLLSFSDSISLPLEKNKFVWWLLVNLSRVLPLYMHKHQISCWELCRDCVITLANLQSDSSSPQLAFSLWSIIKLSKYWGQSMDSVMLLWESFSKKLGDMTNNTNHKAMSVRNISELRYHIINNPSEVNNPLQVSSFELFLRFFSLQFSLVEELPTDYWKRYKGRFYSKLSFRRLQNLKSDSILNLYLLTFVLGYKTDADDVIDKSSELFLKLLSNSSSVVPSATLLLIWESLFGLFHVFTDKAISLSNYLSKILPKLCEYQNIAMFDANYAKLHWEVCNLMWLELPELSSCPELIHSVLEVLQELYVSHYSAFHKEHIVVTALNITQVLISIYNLLVDNSSVRETSEKVCLFLWEFGYPNWRQDHLSVSSVPEMGPLISRLILLSIISECNPVVSFSDVVKEVLFCNNLPCQVGCLFIQGFICEEIGRRHVSQHLIFIQLFTKAWVLYIIQTHRYPQFTPSLIACTNLLRTLSIFGQTTTVSCLSDVIIIFESLLKQITLTGESYRDSQYFFISEFLEWIEPHLCDPSTSKECLFAIYRLSYSLVRYCPAVIYSHTQTNCILPRLIEYLFFPTHSLSKLPHPAHLDCVRGFLIEFLSSLFMLQSETDQFIQRKIRQLFSKYFYRFQQQSQGNVLVSSKDNPFLSLFDSDLVTEQNSFPTNLHPALCALSVIRGLFLKLPQPPTTLIQTLLFLHKMTDIASNELLASSGEHLLFPMLGCLLACNECPTNREPQQIRELAETVIQRILRAVTRMTSICHRHKLVESITTFVAANMPSCHGKVFTTLRIIAQIDPHLIALCIGEFRSLLLEFEKGNPKVAAEIRIELNRLESILK